MVRVWSVSASEGASLLGISLAADGAGQDENEGEVAGAIANV
jgi:hypothetical protein